MKKQSVAYLVFTLIGAWALPAEKTPPKMPQNAVDVSPSSRVMVDGLGTAADAAKLVAVLPSADSPAYGFATGISKEKGSFKLGVLVTDLELTLKAGDRGRSKRAAEALNRGLAELGAPLEMVQAVVNLQGALEGATPVSAIYGPVMAVLRPFLDAFVAKEGQQAFMRFGEWVESMRLAMASGELGNTKVARGFFKGLGLADHFARTLPADKVPQGVKDGLAQIKESAKNASPTDENVLAARKTLENILAVLG